MQEGSIDYSCYLLFSHMSSKINSPAAAKEGV